MLNLDLAKKIADLVENRARELGFKATVAIVDTAGLPILLRRMDGALVVSPKFALAKAYTSATLMMPTSALAPAVMSNAPYHGLTDLDPYFTTIAGGLPLVQGQQVIGGIGVGGSPDPRQDEVCAQAGVDFLDTQNST